MIKSEDWQTLLQKYSSNKEDTESKRKETTKKFYLGLINMGNKGENAKNKNSN